MIIHFLWFIIIRGPPTILIPVTLKEPMYPFLPNLCSNLILLIRRVLGLVWIIIR